MKIIRGIILFISGALTGFLAREHLIYHPEDPEIMAGIVGVFALVLVGVGMGRLIEKDKGTLEKTYKED